jgi:hypothetical protein
MNSLMSTICIKTPRRLTIDAVEYSKFSSVNAEAVNIMSACIQLTLKCTVLPVPVRLAKQRTELSVARPDATLALSNHRLRTDESRQS